MNQNLLKGIIVTSEILLLKYLVQVSRFLEGLKKVFWIVLCVFIAFLICSCE